MAPRKSIFRQEGAQHFQVVHRSQRDPLIHDSEASQHVLKPFERENVRKGKSRTDLELALSPSDLAQDLARANIGEASAYGVYYDDTEYDYMQHLRQVGVAEDGVDSVLLQAPMMRSHKGKGTPLTLRDIPQEALPSTSELPRNYEAQEAIPSSIAGFQPDMDPHLRQVLEALEDDAFVDEALEDDFFGALIDGGERGADEEFEVEFIEDGADRTLMGPNTNGTEGEETSWEARFEEFRRSQKTMSRDIGPCEEDDHSEGGDTIGTLRQLSVLGGKRRRNATSDASGYSMSSSSMFRNEGLTILDERFDQIEKDYAEADEADTDDDDDDGDEAPELLTSREDFDAMMDDFLHGYEIVGRKMAPVLAGDTAGEKLDTLRHALGAARLDNLTDDIDGEILMPLEVDRPKERWDCETVLSTYSNLDNHPQLIRARDGKSVVKIRLNSRTGLPAVKERPEKGPRKAPPVDSSSPTDDSGEDDESRPIRVTIARPRNESKEEKKARKLDAKAERQIRRVEKKANRERFSSEFKQQAASLANRDADRIRKL